MNLEKYRESEMFKKCWEIQRNAEKFREMQRNGQFYSTPPNILLGGISEGWPLWVGWIPPVAIPNPVPKWKV